MTKSETASYWHCLLPEEVKVINQVVSNREAMSDEDWKLLGIIAARLVKEREEQSERDIVIARDLAVGDDWADDDVEVDADAVVLRVDDGYWVQAWAFIYNDDVEEELQAYGEV